PARALELPKSSRELAAAHRACARAVRRQAANFYFAFRLLPARRRRALLAVYQFCRAADDIADGEGSAEERRAALEGFRRPLSQTLEGRPPTAEWLVLWDAVRTFSLPAEQLNEVIDGCLADCSPLLVETESDLNRYCYGVAGAVGLLSARIFGYRDARVPELAVRLGEAMQLTNILRDLAEDSRAGRCYLPQEDLRRFGLEPADLLLGPRGPKGEGYSRLMAFEVDRARERFLLGCRLIPLVARGSRGCPAALAALYRALLDQIVARGYEVQSTRVALSTRRKLSLAGWAWLSATLGS
ncbi:MAG: phytoene/squalene synthase family protein, partial [Candidatus Dormibacteria bacterium]